MELPSHIPQKESSRHLFFENIEVKPARGKIFVISRMGAIAGIGVDSISLIRPPGSRVFRKVWAIELDERLGKFGTYLPSLQLLNLCFQFPETRGPSL